MLFTIITAALFGACLVGFVFGFLAGRADCPPAPLINGLSEPRPAVHLRPVRSFYNGMPIAAVAVEVPPVLYDWQRDGEA